MKCESLTRTTSRCLRDVVLVNVNTQMSSLFQGCSAMTCVTHMPPILGTPFSSFLLITRSNVIRLSKSVCFSVVLLSFPDFLISWL